MKLISMTSFVLAEGNPSNTDEQFANKVMAYANFIRQPLELWMFDTCDEDGNVLEEPPKNVDGNNVAWQIEYQQAKEKCLFENLIIINKGNFYFIEKENSTIYQRVLSKNTGITIECLLSIFKDIQLTQTAIKQLGL